MVVKLDVSGVGMTSQRTRNRLTERLREQGIVNETVLQVMGSTPTICLSMKPYLTVPTRIPRYQLAMAKPLASLISLLG